MRLIGPERRLARVQLEQESAAAGLERDEVPKARPAAQVEEVERRRRVGRDWNRQELHAQSDDEAGRAPGGAARAQCAWPPDENPRKHARDEQGVRAVDAEVQSEHETEHGQIAPRMIVVGVPPPAHHGEQDETREHRGQDVRRELRRVLPQRRGERKGQCTERNAGVAEAVLGLVDAGKIECLDGDEIDEGRGHAGQCSRQQIDGVRR